ncbi:MAG: cation:proton antiporter [Verrucomicrobiales bacterium]|nr:cation:proton antiporter [Verrucomicrobiales bacterium]
MPHDVSLLSTIAVGFVLAFVLGFIAIRCRLPPLVGYLVAGIALGPHTPGFVADSGVTSQLAEIGVILLMFGVGLHFSLADLVAVRRLAIPGAVGQIVLATALGAGMAMMWGWSLGAGLVLGLSLSVASTVVLLKALEGRRGVETTNGRIAVGWLIVEDLAMVMVLVLLPALSGVLGGKVTDGHEGAAAGGDGILLTLAVTLGKVMVFGVVALVLGPKVMPWLLRQAARTGSREMFTLAVLAISVGIAFGSAKLFGVSFALGAFIAGVVLHESDLSHKAATNSLPLQDAFAVLFFVSVGMLFDPSVLVRQPLMVGSVLLLVLIAKSVIAGVVVLALGYPASTALTVSAALAQVGEFSFILAGLGITQGMMPAEGMNLILAAALLSISVNPLMFLLGDRLTGFVIRNPALRDFLEFSRQGPLTRLEGELKAARELADTRSKQHKAFSPEELVRHFPLFAGLSAEQQEVVILHFDVATAQPGERIIRAGDLADRVYFLSSGEVEVSVGRRQIKLSPGSYFGEMALISGQPRSADVTALDYCRLLTLSRRDFREILRRHPEIKEAMALTASQREEMNRQEALETGTSTDSPV